MSRSHATMLLVIEADSGLRGALAGVLAAEGCRVLQARDVTGGLRIAQECQPEAILLILGPAPERGLALLERLRAGEATRYIPIVAVTRGPPEAGAGHELPPESVLPKHFDLEDLLAHVARVARPELALAGVLST